MVSLVKISSIRYLFCCVTESLAPRDFLKFLSSGTLELEMTSAAVHAMICLTMTSNPRPAGIELMI